MEFTFIFSKVLAPVPDSVFKLLLRYRSQRKEITASHVIRVIILRNYQPLGGQGRLLYSCTGLQCQCQNLLQLRPPINAKYGRGLHCFDCLSSSASIDGLRQPHVIGSQQIVKGLSHPIDNKCRKVYTLGRYITGWQHKRKSILQITDLPIVVAIIGRAFPCNIQCQTLSCRSNDIYLFRHKILWTRLMIHFFRQIIILRPTGKFHDPHAYLFILECLDGLTEVVHRVVDLVKLCLIHQAAILVLIFIVDRIGRLNCVLQGVYRAVLILALAVFCVRPQVGRVGARISQYIYFIIDIQNRCPVQMKRTIVIDQLDIGFSLLQQVYGDAAAVSRFTIPADNCGIGDLDLKCPVLQRASCIDRQALRIGNAYRIKRQQHIADRPISHDKQLSALIYLRNDQRRTAGFIHRDEVSVLVNAILCRDSDGHSEGVFFHHGGLICTAEGFIIVGYGVSPILHRCPGLRYIVAAGNSDLLPLLERNAQMHHLIGVV